MATRSSSRAVLTCIAVSLGACSGYTTSHGKPAYHYWNEGSGGGTVEVDGADPTTFRALPGDYFACDRSHVYYQGRVFPAADAASFESIGHDYWRDRAHVFLFDEQVPGADPKTFVPLKYSPWGKDAEYIYIRNDRIKPRDMATFQLLNEYWARDAGAYYAGDNGGGHMIDEADYASFHILQGAWAKDRAHVYYGKVVAAGADPATFEVINDARGQDKNGAYMFGIPDTHTKRSK